MTGFFKNSEDVLLTIMSTLLLNEIAKNQIDEFIDNSYEKSLSENEVILKAGNKSFRIIVQEIGGIINE